MAHTSKRAELELLGGARIGVRLRVNPRARRISLRIDPSEGEVVLTAPHAREWPRALAFAAERTVWLSTQLARLPQRAGLAPGAVIPIGGVPHALTLVPGRAAPRLEPGPPAQLVSAAPDAELFAARVRRFLHAEAGRRLRERVLVHCGRLGVRCTKLTIKDTKSRWGSCSAAGALAFSWRVVLAPPEVLDYLAAHEVAHLREMNHSPRFWAHVRACQPDYERWRAWLKRHGAALHAID